MIFRGTGYHWEHRQAKNYPDPFTDDPFATYTARRLPWVVSSRKLW